MNELFNDNTGSYLSAHLWIFLTCTTHLIWKVRCEALGFVQLRDFGFEMSMRHHSCLKMWALCFTILQSDMFP